jgi:hypothetical protein
MMTHGYNSSFNMDNRAGPYGNPHGMPSGQYSPPYGAGNEEVPPGMAYRVNPATLERELYYLPPSMDVDNSYGGQPHSMNARAEATLPNAPGTTRRLALPQ